MQFVVAVIYTEIHSTTFVLLTSLGMTAGTPLGNIASSLRFFRESVFETLKNPSDYVIL